MGPPTPEQQLDALWQTYAPAVLRYARRRVMSGEVDEVVAETFVVAWRRLDQVPVQPLPWLLGVARGVSANVLRTARRRDALTDRLHANADRGPAGGPGPDSEWLSAEVEGALALLTAEDRELLTLLAWDRLTRQETALALGITRGALAVRLHRARRRMQNLLPEPALRPTPSGDAGHRHDTRDGDDALRDTTPLLPRTGRP